MQKIPLSLIKYIFYNSYSIILQRGMRGLNRSKCTLLYLTGCYMQVRYWSISCSSRVECTVYAINCNTSNKCKNSWKNIQLFV